jgi:fumarylacetoacetase
LEPFRIPGPEQSPEPLEYLRPDNHWALDIPLEVLLQSESMESPDLIVQSNFKHLYWTPAQQLAHHTSTGCNLRPGDLLASGTVSGPDKRSRGCMLELSWRGQEPIKLSSGEERTFLNDGDRVTIRAACERDGLKIGFGEVTGTLLPALSGKRK